MNMPISLAVVAERLENYGGSEIYILECMRRWQKDVDIVVYTTRFSPALFREFGIDEDKVTVEILEQPENKKNRFSFMVFTCRLA